MASKQSFTELADMLTRLLTSGLDDAEWDSLKAMLAADDAARQYYVEFMALSAHLQKYHAGAALRADDGSVWQEDDADPVCGLAEILNEDWDASGDDTQRVVRGDVADIQRYAEKQLQTFLAEEEKIRQQARRRYEHRSTINIGDYFHRFAGQMDVWITRAAKMTVRLAAVAAVLLLVVGGYHFVRSRQVVAQLTDSAHAKWEQAPVGTELQPGKLSLEEGFAKLVLKKGAEVIVQAPCVFELYSKNRMILHTGMVTAQVPPQASGFTVDTPLARVVDFGTEFGVSANARSTSEIHVFEGRVQVQSRRGKWGRRVKQDLSKGLAAIVDAAGDLSLNALTERPNLFARRLPNDLPRSSVPNRTLDLADIVGGGSGFGTGQLHVGINPVSGNRSSIFSHEQRQGVRSYLAVPSQPFIDGVFVPPMEGGLVQISSASHLYEFPPTSGAWWVEITNGGLANMEKVPPTPLVLEERTYGTRDYPAILMHANVGITFDLETIRAALNGTCITAFSTIAGISSNVEKDADVVIEVLVNGQIRFHQHLVLGEQVAPKIHIALDRSDRFLTLVCTEGQINRGDWSFFGEPVLELESDKKNLRLGNP